MLNFMQCCMPINLGPSRKEAEKAMDETFQVPIEEPWSREGPMTRELFHDAAVNGKARFHLIDLWHSVHLGIGKTWIASGVMMLQQLLPDSAVDRRAWLLGAEYKAFCKRMKMDAILRKVELSTFGTTTDPIGAWNKAAITSNFFLFLEDFCERHSEEIQRDERMRIFASR